MMRTGAQVNHFLIKGPLSHFCSLLFTAIVIVIAVVTVLGRTSASCPLAVVVAICILNFMNTGTVRRNGNERGKLV